MSKKLKGNLILLITTIAWGSSFVAQRLGMSENTLTPTSFISMRTLMGGIVLLPFILFGKKNDKKKHPAENKNLLIGGIVTGVILCFASVMQTWGMAFPDTSAGKAGFITALYIIFVPIVGFFMGKKVSPLVLVGIIMATLGMYLLCSLNTSESLMLSRGDFYVLISSILYTFHILSIDYFTERVQDAVKLACIQFFVCGLLTLFWTFITRTFSPSEIWKNILPILYSGVISCGIGYTLQNVGQKYTDPTSASLIMSLESVFSAISGALFLHEYMTSTQTLGCALTFAAVIITQFPIEKLPFKCIKNQKKQ